MGYRKISNDQVFYLKNQLSDYHNNSRKKINYVVNKDFDLSVFKNGSIDLIVSQAAFEHFDNVEKTIEDMSKIVKQGGIFIAEIDLSTHSRWIREKDPLNIYRYNKWFYNFLKFKGSPNRVRPVEYEKIFQKNGWAKIKIFPKNKVESELYYQTCSYLNKQFLSTDLQMELLSFIICCTKA